MLANTLVANVTSSFLWFALTFWAYLETRSVMATAIIGGGFMLFTAVFGTYFGTLVDRHRKKQVMVVSSTVTLVTYAASGVLWLLLGEGRLADWESPWFWLFAAVILVGGVVESLRNIALSTTVTLLVPGGRSRQGQRPGRHGPGHRLHDHQRLQRPERRPARHGLDARHRDRADRRLAAPPAAGHRSPSSTPSPEEGGSRFDVRGAVAAIRAVPGLVALILFSTFNNLVSGVYIALMDPYGLTLFSVEAWGIVLGVTGLGFVVGGGLVARFGLGANPVRTLLLVNLGIAVLGMTFTLREWAWLYVLGIFVFMAIIPAAESAEQTILQRVVPFRTQGRVFGFAQSVELAASPISAFLIGPIAEFWLIPYMDVGRGPLDVGLAGRQRRGARHRAGLPGRRRDHVRRRC